MSPRTRVCAFKEREIFYAFTPYIGKWKFYDGFLTLILAQDLSLDTVLVRQPVSVL